MNSFYAFLCIVNDDQKEGKKFGKIPTPELKKSQWQNP